MNANDRGRIFGVYIAVILLACQAVSADAGADHQALQVRPIQLGTSGGNIQDISSLYCCSGTLGALVEDVSGAHYILSNNHVLARFNQGIAGELVNQPGMIDQNCLTNGAVGSLASFINIKVSKGKVIQYNIVDAAIAAVNPGQVAVDGAILDIGPLSGGTVGAFVGQAVQKSGRTTGHTMGTVLNIDVTTSVGYSLTCGGASNQVAYFKNQIRIGNASFSDGGDSGSLIVESGATDPVTGLPRSVGLLFAGDSSSTVANPIGAVLGALGVTLVGGTSVSGPTGSIAGVVSNSVTGLPIVGAAVSVDGQSATTDGAGAYFLEGVDTGSHTVTASASGFMGASHVGVEVSESQTTVSDFALVPNSVPTVASPGCVIYTTSGGKSGTANLVIGVKVVNDFGAAVSGATVNISVNRNGSLAGTGSGAVTNSSGIASYILRNAAAGAYSTTVTNIAASGLAFAGALSTPPNSFTKGTDATPAQFCADGVSPSGASVGARGTSMNSARAANARNSARLMGFSGVTGHGVGLGDDGKAVIDVFVAKGAKAPVPSQLDGVAVRIIETDGFIAY